MTLQKIKVKEITLSWTKKPSREATVSKTAKQPGAEILYDDISITMTLQWHKNDKIKDYDVDQVQ
jgi:hypothetical protein